MHGVKASFWSFKVVDISTGNQTAVWSHRIRHFCNIYIYNYIFNTPSNSCDLLDFWKNCACFLLIKFIYSKKKTSPNKQQPPTTCWFPSPFVPLKPWVSPTNVQWMPEAVVSCAVARAVWCANLGSQEAASPKGMGKTVHMPWITSWWLQGEKKGPWWRLGYI